MAKHRRVGFFVYGIFVDTVGKNAKKIEKYIRNQLQEDLEYDQMTFQSHVKNR